METVNDVAVRSRNVGLLEALDRVLDTGVVVDGDVYLCVAGIELVYLKLKLLLASTATVERFDSGGVGDILKSSDIVGTTKGPVVKNEALQPRCPSGLRSAQDDRSRTRVLGDVERAPLVDKPASGKVDIDPKKVEQGLAKLVLTLVELLRKLMEKQALRRVELGTLTEKDIDSLGEAFMRLDEKMKELKKVFGLKDSDLNLDLGPVGDLI